MVYGMNIFITGFQWLTGKIRSLESEGSKRSPAFFTKSTPPPQLPMKVNIQGLAHRYDGKLLLREEINLPNDLFQHLLTQNLFIAIPSILRTPLNYKCMRCFGKQISQFAKIPCLRCGREHVYCRSCVEMGRILACESLYYWSGETYHWPEQETPCSWHGTLTPAQQYASNQIVRSIEQRKQILVWAVTGAGKTEMLFPGITVALKKGLRICIATPRADVVRELLPRLRDAFRSILIQGLYAGSRDHDGTAQLIIATTHQLFRYRNAFDVLIIDEIDAFPYNKDTSLQKAANRAKKKKASVIYLTATPREKQRRQMLTKQLDYIFVPVRFHGQPLIIPQWILTHSLEKALLKNQIPKQIQTWLKGRTTSTRQLLIFIPTIRYLQAMMDPFRTFLLEEKLIRSKIQIESVHAEDSKRKEKVEAFRNKQTTILLTTTILERGVTFPSIDVMILHAGHHVFDEAALIQISGRVGRSPRDPHGEVVLFHNGKTDAMVRANQAIKEMNRLQQKLPHYKNLQE